MTSNSAGAVIKLPRHVYSRNSEASVSNDGKTLLVFFFFSSVIKFDKDHYRPTVEVDHCFCKVKN